MASNIQLKTTVELTTRFIYNSPLLYVNSGELSYSIGDWVRQFMLSPPFVWRWNRGEVAPITCIQGETDYTVNIPDFGWLERAWILFPQANGIPVQIFNSMNILNISVAANIVTVVLNGNPINFGFYVGQTISIQQVTNTAYNSFQTVVISGMSPNTISYSQTLTQAPSSGGIVFNIVSLPQNTITSPQGSPVLTKELSIVTTLAAESVLNQPEFISVIADDNNGNITFRLMGSPDAAYTLYLIYQKAAPKFNAVTDTWAPIPDYFSYIYNLGYLSKSYEYKGDERFAFAHQEFLRMVTAANDGLTDEQKNIFLGPRLITQRQIGEATETGQLGRRSRAGV